MIDLNALAIAIRSRLIADSTLMGLVEGVWRGAVPSTWTGTLPAVETGVQSETGEDWYNDDASDILVRLMVHDKSSAPGVGSYDRAYTALIRADIVLTSAPLVVPGHSVMAFYRSGGIPESMPADDDGYRRPAVGNLYRVRIQVN